MRKLPRVSVITAVYNGDKFLEQTIKSIIGQTYENIEFIIIDGGSTDNTLSVIDKYKEKISYWESSSDRGISDAFNKGVSKASGDYLIFQGDGDGFVEHEVVAKVMEDVDPGTDLIISGRIKRVDLNGKELFVSKHVKKFNKASLLFKMSLPHQGLFIHRSLFEKYGLFDVGNRFCMDYEHLLRMYKDFPIVKTKDIVVAIWRNDGLGTGKTIEILKEYNEIKYDNKVAAPFVLTLLHKWIIMKYHIKKILGMQ